MTTGTKTAHLNRANGKAACGRMRGVYTPNVFNASEFRASMHWKGWHVCRRCAAAYWRVPGIKKR